LANVFLLQLALSAVRLRWMARAWWKCGMAFLWLYGVWEAAGGACSFPSNACHKPKHHAQCRIEMYTVAHPSAPYFPVEL